MKKGCPLVLIEWEDSRRPDPHWRHLSTISAPEIIRCASVGWLLHDDKSVKRLAPNMGDLTASPQVAGVIEIPTRCVVRVHRLKEPTLSW